MCECEYEYNDSAVQESVWVCGVCMSGSCAYKYNMISLKAHSLCERKNMMKTCH